ncbi:MAG: gliding motility protein GldC [Bernardetiaceae bacterium]
MAKQSDIRFSIELDDKNFIDKIFWRASDAPTEGLSEAKAVALSVWDHNSQETLRIDLWTQDMPMQDMKRLCLDTLFGLADTIQQATNDDFMASKMHELCEIFVEHLKKENSDSPQPSV